MCEPNNENKALVDFFLAFFHSFIFFSILILYVRMRKLSFSSGYIKQDASFSLFYFRRLSGSHTSHSLRHRFLGLSTSSLTFRQRAHYFFSVKRPFFRQFHLDIPFSLYPTPYLFGTQQQLTHPPVNSSSQEYVNFSGLSSRHIVFILSCVGCL